MKQLNFNKTKKSYKKIFKNVLINYFIYHKTQVVSMFEQLSKKVVIFVSNTTNINIIHFFGLEHYVLNFVHNCLFIT